MDIKEHLAIKVMGLLSSKGFYYKKVPSNLTVDGIDDFFNQLALCTVEDWNPLKNIEQAFMCADVVEKEPHEILCSISNFEPEYWRVSAQLPTVKYITEYHKNPATALSTAIAKATGWEE